MNNLIEGKYGHGAIPKKWDINDHKAHRLGMADAPFDWTAGFDIVKKVPNIITENQFESFSCGGQADRYYLGVLKALNTGIYERLSAHDPYCQIFYPGGGTTIRDIGNLSVQKGIRNEATVPSYLNNDCPESFMEDRSLTNAAPNAAKFAEIGYAFPKTDIESVAQAIRDNNGCILEINGQNNGTWLSKFPKNPTATEWKHFLYAGKALIINGVKYIGVLNSWGAEIGDGGWQYLDSNYFHGNVTDALVFYDKNLYQYQPTIVQKVASGWLDKFLNWAVNYFILPYITNP